MTKQTARVQWMVEKEYDGLLLRDYLQDVQGISRRLLKTVKYGGGAMMVNREIRSVRSRLQAGDQIELQFPPEVTSGRIQPEPIPLSIVYEDDAVLVIDKPAGMATIPSINHPSGTIANAVLAYYQQQHLPFTVHIVTRLDRDTSGLLLIAKHRYSHSLLSKAQQHGTIKRSYQAITEGELVLDQCTIDEPIGRKEGSIIQRTVTEDGKCAHTAYKVIRRQNGYSLVDVTLQTGRTHQIRVHFSHIGYPITGDQLYGASGCLINRQALHCSSLAFDHPFTAKPMIFQSALPEDMNNLLIKTL